MQMVADYLLQNKISLKSKIKMMTAGAPPPEAVLSKMETVVLTLFMFMVLQKFMGLPLYVHGIQSGTNMTPLNRLN